MCNSFSAFRLVCKKGEKRILYCILTFNLLFWGLDMAQHPGHVDAVPVHVLEEDICISPGQSACLTEIRLVRNATTLHLGFILIL